MPAFTFEKISPPTRRTPATAPAAEKPRSVIAQLMERLADSRGKRKMRADQARDGKQAKSGQ